MLDLVFRLSFHCPLGIEDMVAIIVKHRGVIASEITTIIAFFKPIAILKLLIISLLLLHLKPHSIINAGNIRYPTLAHFDRKD